MSSIKQNRIFRLFNVLFRFSIKFEDVKYGEDYVFKAKLLPNVT